MIEQENVMFDLETSTREEAIDKLVQKAAENGKVTDKQFVVNTVLAREKESTTGFGKGIAIPHGKSAGVTEPVLMFARTTQALGWASMDDQPVQDIFLILVPENSSDEHLQILAKLARKLMHNDFVETLRNMNSADDLTHFLKEELA